MGCRLVPELIVPVCSSYRLAMKTRDATALLGEAVSAEESFQKLLLKFSADASQITDAPSIIRLFCQTTREYFRVHGVYYWGFTPPEDLIGAEADGTMAKNFRGTRIKITENTVIREALEQRKAVYASRAKLAPLSVMNGISGESVMAAPIMVDQAVIGVMVFLHNFNPNFFDDGIASKATILTHQLGSLLEAGRVGQMAQEEHRRAEVLAEIARALHSVPDVAAVAEAVADRLRIFLRTRLVCVLLHDGAGFSLQAVATESLPFATSVRARFDRKGLQFAADLATRAMKAGEAITIALEPSMHTMGDLVPAGILIAVPMHTPRTPGAILVFPREEGVFSAEEKSLISAVAGFGAVAMANAELYTKAQSQTHELHQLLDISSELGSLSDLDRFMEQFVLRAADFLGFERTFIALLEEGNFQIHWGAGNGQTVRMNLAFPDGIGTRTLMNKEVFWWDDPKTPGLNQEMIAKYNVRQLLAVPLLGTRGQVLGMFGVMDRVDKTGISQEDIRRARALAAQVAVALEATRNLHLAEAHRQRADSLMRLARELNSRPRLEEFAKEFVAQVREMTSAQGAALVVKQNDDFKTIVLEGIGQSIPDASLLRRFSAAVAEAAAQRGDAIFSKSPTELFGASLAQDLGWRDCTLVRLPGSSGDLAGVLCLADRTKPLAREDEQCLQAIAGQASAALENAFLFSRIEQASRHWVEIFDAISDFIVVHDSLGNVLRVNRSLAEFIGVQPRELIGLSITALLALGKEIPLQACPFCRDPEETAEECVHSVLDRTYLVSTSRVHAASSEGLQTIHVMKDITDRQEAERRYRELFDNIQEGLFFATPDGRFVEVNDALVRILGYHNREELLQADIRTQVYCVPERYQELAEQMQQHGVVRSHEEKLRRLDGSIVHVLINGFAVRDREDRIVQYRGVMLDISGLKSYQVELQRERDFSGKILNNTQSLILVVDTAGLISYANNRWYEIGYSQGQLLGMRLGELAAPPGREALQRAFNETLSGQQVDNLELQIIRGDGQTGYFSINLSPMRDDQNNVTSLVVVMTDITDAALLQAKLVHTEKMAAVGQLVSGVAHEVNNPLTAILGFTDLLMENPDLPEAAYRDLRVILQEAQRTKQIVQNLLSFARQMPPQRKAIQINPILRRTIQLRAYDLNNHQVDVIEQLDQELPLVIGDAHQLQQVFLNILNNAYDAVRETERPGRIEIMTARSGDSVEILFRDNGQGIAHPERIFDPFFTTKEVGKGTGLGLSICYGIVHEHGGEVLCHNNAQGTGATFLVRLPAAPVTDTVGGALL